MSSFYFPIKRGRFFAKCVFLAMVTLGSVQSALATTVDILLLYTPGVTSHYNGSPETRFNHLASVTNQIYSDSGLDINIRFVHMLEVNYPDAGDSGDALGSMTNQSHSAFTNIPALRTQYGADMVLLYRPYKRDHNSCGIAWLGGYFANGNMTNSINYMFSHVSVTLCGDYVTAHELGHNMGLHHSRKQSPNGGTLPHATGHGVDFNFVTVMAYTSAFSVNYWTGKEYKFASPNLDCRGFPCGISQNDSVNGADAVAALNVTVPQIANFYPTVISDGGGDGDGDDPVDETDAERDARLAFEAAENLLNDRGDDLSEAITKEKAAIATYDAAVAEVKRIDAERDSLFDEITAAKTVRDQFAIAYRNALRDSRDNLDIDVDSARFQYDSAKTTYNNLKADRTALDDLYDAAKSTKRTAKTAKRTAKTRVRSASIPYDSAKRAFNRAADTYQDLLDQRDSGDD